MFSWLPYQRRGAEFKTLIVSPNTMEDLLRTAEANMRYSSAQPSINGRGIHGFALHTSFGQLDVKVDRNMPNDDLILKDTDGNIYSYSEGYVNEMVEKIILGGNNG